MTFVFETIYTDCEFNAHEFKCLNVGLNVKAVVAAFNQEKAFSMITNIRVNL